MRVCGAVDIARDGSYAALLMGIKHSSSCLLMTSRHQGSPGCHTHAGDKLKLKISGTFSQELAHRIINTQLPAKLNIHEPLPLLLLVFKRF